MDKKMSWSDEVVYELIEKVLKDVSISHFPTHRELNEYYGNRSLSVQISRRGGTKRWADIFNLPVAMCKNTNFGSKYEMKAIEDIKQETGFNSELTKPRYPYDILTDQSLKIDIKASKPSRGKNFDCWSFNLEKNMPTCDIYIFYCLKWTDEISKRLIIPSCALNGIKQLGIGSLSKYDNYVERWDLIKNYGDFLSEMKTKIDLIPKRRSQEVD